MNNGRTPAPTDESGALDFSEPRPAPLSEARRAPSVAHIHVYYHDAAIILDVAGKSVREVEDLIDGLLAREGWAASPTSGEWRTTPDGLPICPKHGAPMKRREKQGDTWYSHAVGEDAKGEAVYCKGYKGTDSPGFDL